MNVRGHVVAGIAALLAVGAGYCGVSGSGAVRAETPPATTSTTGGGGGSGPLEAVSGELAEGETLSTAGGHPTDVLAASLTTPVAGHASINEHNTLDSGLSRYIRRAAVIDGPAATTANPARIVLRVDSSALPAPESAQTLEVRRSVTLIERCTGTPGTASPDPCIDERVTRGDGDAQVTILTSDPDGAWILAYPIRTLLVSEALNSFGLATPGSSISGDGKWAAYAGNASDGAPTSVTQALVRNLEAREASVVMSRNAAGEDANAETGIVRLSHNGRFVSFTSAATNLGGPADGDWHTFIHDRDLDGNLIFDEPGGPNQSTVPALSVKYDYDTVKAISDDGRYAVHYLITTEPFGEVLAPFPTLWLADRDADDNGILDDSGAPAMEQIDVAPDGAPGNNSSDGPRITPDGRYVVFASQASNLVAGDANGRSDIFRRDLTTGTTELVSTALGGGPVTTIVAEPSISIDGTQIAYRLFTDDFPADIVVRDLTASRTTLMTVGIGGGGADSDSALPVISGNGRHVAFESQAANLVEGDAPLCPNSGGSGFKQCRDVFLVDRDPLEDGFDGPDRSIELVSLNSFNEQLNRQSDFPSINDDGTSVFFNTNASSVTPDDQDQVCCADLDVFIRRRQVAAPPAVPDQVVDQDVNAGDSVRSGDLNAGASATDPVVTGVRSPNGGSVVINESNEPTAPVGGGFEAANFRVDISAPQATVAEPLELTFRIDGSVLPSGTTVDTLQVRRNGAIVPACTSPDLGNPEADPDPCVARRLAVDDDIELTVWTSTASVWDAVVGSAVNTPPEATPMSVTTREDRAVAITLAASDADGDTLTYTHNGVRHGWLSGSGKSLTYHPVKDFFGPDQFRFTVTDPSGAKASAVVRITVTEMPKIATVLSARGKIVRVGPAPGTPAAQLSATLTRGPSGSPVLNRSVVFRINGANVCRASTNRAGVATCTIRNATLRSQALEHGFDAVFAGDADYKPSSAHGSVAATG